MNLPIPEPQPPQAPERDGVWAVVLGYAVFAGLWIVLSNALVHWVIRDDAGRLAAQNVKGWAFVLATAALLFALLRRRERSRALARASAKAAEQERFRVLTLLQAIADNSTDSIFVKDREGRYQLFNREAARLTGLKAERSLGFDDADVFSPEAAAMIRANDERVMTLARPETFEEVLDTADGQIAYLSTKGPLRDAAGTVVGMFGISRDITAWKAALQQANENELKYRFMFDASPLPMWAFDRDTLRYVTVNQAALTRYGYTRDEFLAMTIIDLRPPHERDKLRAAVAGGLIERKFELGETRAWVHQAKDGRLFDVEVASSDVAFEGHRARLMVVHDVTRQRELERQREAALADTEAARDLLREVLARVDDGFVALDTEWHYTYVNDKAAQMFGRERGEDLIGCHIWTEFPDGVDQPFHRAYQEAMQTQRPVHFEEHYAPWDRWFENRVYPSPQGLSIYFTDVTDRKQAEEILRHREREFRQLADQMPAIIYRKALDEGARTLYISPHVIRLGRTPEQWMADRLSWTNAVHPDDLDRAVEERRAGLACGGDFRIEYRMRDAQGAWRHFRDTARRVAPEGGGAPYLQGVAIDITEHVLSEVALRASEERLRSSERRYRLAAVQDRVWEWDRERGEVQIAPLMWRTLELLPPAPTQALSSLMTYMPADDAARLREALTRHLRDREPYDIEFRARGRQGRLHWFHTQGQAIWDPQGRATYMAGTTVGIDERKQAEEALRESEAYRTSLFEQLADGVLLLDQQHRLLDANPQALEMIGYDASQLPQLTLDDLLSVHDRSRVEGDLTQMLAGRTQLLEWDFQRRDGSGFPAEVSVRAIGQGRVLAVLRDVSLRRETERALLGYQLELSELTQRLLMQEKQTTQRIAQVLHDHLGQTLAVARLNLDATVATHGDTMSEALREKCGQVSRLVDQAVRETRQMLAELRPPLLEERGLGAALDNEVRQRTAMAGHVDLLLEVEDGLTTQRWPADLEYGAFMIAREAITNALQHAHPTLVRVLLGGGAGSLTLEVRDDGRGIPAALREGRPGHLGLVGMRERAIAVGARIDLVDGDDGGTCVCLRWEA